MSDHAFRDLLERHRWTRGWAKHVPSPDALKRNRWLRPFAEHLSTPAIWRWNRRSVARGAALGMFITIAVPLPIQIVLAALLAVFVRANVPVAVVCAFISNPLTTPAFLAAGYGLGKLLLAIDDKLAPALDGSSLPALERLFAFLAEASLPLAVGLLALATLTAAASYVAVHLIWRVRVGGRWARRRQSRRLAAAA